MRSAKRRTPRASPTSCFSIRKRPRTSALPAPCSGRFSTLEGAGAAPPCSGRCWLPARGKLPPRALFLADRRVAGTGRFRADIRFADFAGGVAGYRPIPCGLFCRRDRRGMGLPRLAVRLRLPGRAGYSHGPSLGRRRAERSALDAAILRQSDARTYLYLRNGVDCMRLPTFRDDGRGVSRPTLAAQIGSCCRRAVSPPQRAGCIWRAFRDGWRDELGPLPRDLTPD